MSPDFSEGESKKDNIIAEDPNKSLSYPKPNDSTLRSFACFWNLHQICHNLNQWLLSQATAFLADILGAEIEILIIKWHKLILGGSEFSCCVFWVSNLKTKRALKNK